MDQRTLKPITETKYLSVENAWRYRAIMRFFYISVQQYRLWLHKEDVFEHLRREAAFQDYTLELCLQDLEALREWRNLNAVQDTAKVSTYQQFVNKQYRYQMTEYAIEIERMTLRLENLFIEGSSLDPTLLERIKEALRRLPDMLTSDTNVLGGWWQQLSHDFQRLNQDYQDYLRDWSSARAEELMKTKSFLLYKEKLVDYLRHFIKELQHHSQEIEGLLRQVTPEMQATLWQRLTHYEMSIPRVDAEQLRAEDVYTNLQGKYQSLHRFFQGSAARESEVETILTMTNEIIRRITRYAAGILEMSSQYTSRREEYRKIATLFQQQPTLDAAHQLASQVFGLGGYRHFAGDLVRETESIHRSVYEEPPLFHRLTPRVRQYREKMLKTAIPDRQAEQQAMREQVLAQRRQEQAVLMNCLQQGEIAFETLGVIDPSVRRSLLTWLSRGLQEQGGIAITEHGLKFRLANPGETRRCRLESSDGSLEMPAYVLDFNVTAEDTRMG